MVRPSLGIRIGEAMLILPGRRPESFSASATTPSVWGRTKFSSTGAKGMGTSFAVMSRIGASSRSNPFSATSADTSVATLQWR